MRVFLLEEFAPNLRTNESQSVTRFPAPAWSGIIMKTLWRFWEPEDFYLRQHTGSIAILADGVGGEGNGDIASRLAAETALRFSRRRNRAPPPDIVRQIFDEASAKDFPGRPGERAAWPRLC